MGFIGLFLAEGSSVDHILVEPFSGVGICVDLNLVDIVIVPGDEMNFNPEREKRPPCPVPAIQPIFPCPG